jgi:hypothetical protein
MFPNNHDSFRDSVVGLTGFPNLNLTGFDLVTLETAHRPFCLKQSSFVCSAAFLV